MLSFLLALLAPACSPGPVCGAGTFEYKSECYPEATDDTAGSTRADGAQLTVDPAELSFVGMAATSPQSAVLTLSNTGNAALLVSDGYIDDDPQDAFSFDTITDLSLAPGESAEYTVVATLPGSVPADGEIRLASDDPERPTVLVPLHAEP